MGVMTSESTRYADDLALAHLLADLADSIALDRYQSLDLVITTKPDNTPVTDADRAVETAIREALATHRPNDGLLGEEFGSDITGAKRYWIIDPIDGTKNFMRGVPTWACLIALVEVSADGTQEVVVGVASSPALSRRWFASSGEGAFVRFNGITKKISVSQVASLSDASITYSDFIGFDDRLEAFQKMLNGAWRTRGMGDFWSHMLVAEGAVDVAIEPTLALWDMAALDIIVREAGGIFTNISGQSGPFGGSGVSTNGVLHNDVINTLNP
jgi:histidinol-phosphatase